MQQCGTDGGEDNDLGECTTMERAMRWRRPESLGMRTGEDDGDKVAATDECRDAHG